MPYKDKAKQREYQRERIAAVRKTWFKENGPCATCGSNEDLELDHVDPKSKEHHSVWSWKEDRRVAELAKCQALCKKCHRKKTNKELARPVPHGTKASYGSRGCRCDACRGAAVKYNKDYYARRNAALDQQ